jgi:hypothetical protein
MSQVQHLAANLSMGSMVVSHLSALGSKQTPSIFGMLK